MTTARLVPPEELPSLVGEVFTIDSFTITTRDEVNAFEDLTVVSCSWQLHAHDYPDGMIEGWKGSYISASWYVVPTGAKDPAVGQAAISMVVRDKQANITYVSDTTYPVDLKTIPFSSYPASVQPWLAIGKNAAQGVESDGNWYAQHPDIEVQFQNWLVQN